MGYLTLAPSPGKSINIKKRKMLNSLGITGISDCVKLASACTYYKSVTGVESNSVCNQLIITITISEKQKVLIGKKLKMLKI